MQLPLPPYKREEIIRLCLKGHSYQKISKIAGISTGSVSNIFNDFLGQAEIDPNHLRFLIKEIKENTNLDLPQFAISYRISNMLALTGIADNKSKMDLESFLNTVYNTCKARNYPAELIMEYVWQLFEVAKYQNMPVEQISDYIQRMISQRTKLEEEINQLNTQWEAAQSRAANALKNAQITEQDVSRYKTAEKELQKYGLSIDDPDKLVAALDNAKEYGYDTKRIVAEISEKESLEQRVSRSQLQKNMDHAAIGFTLSIAIENTIQALESVLSDILSTTNSGQIMNHVFSRDYSFEKEISGIKNAKFNLVKFFEGWHTKDALDFELANTAAKQLRDNLDIAAQELDYCRIKLNITDKKSGTIRTMNLISRTRNIVLNLEDMLSYDRTNYASPAAV